MELVSGKKSRKKDVAVHDEEVRELIEDLEEFEDTAESDEERRLLQKSISTISRFSTSRIFGVDDLAQQLVGGFILSAPFVVTEEVWGLAYAMNWIQWIITVFMVFTIGYVTLYRAADERNADREESIWGLPLRFISLILISYLSVAVLAFLFEAPTVFEASLATTVKAISIGAIFSVVGAATADSVFE